MLDDPFPYLANIPSKGKIVSGELYEVPNDKIIKLDVFEGEGDLYTRETIGVVDSLGHTYCAQTYFINNRVNLNKIIYLSGFD